MDEKLADKWSGKHNFGKVEEAYLKSFKQFKRIHGSYKIIEHQQQSI